MTEKKYVLSLDQGTTSSRAVLFDKTSRIIGIVKKEFPQIYPKNGWVEHDPEAIWTSQKQVMQEVLQRTGVLPEEIACIGITNQRETAMLWDRQTGKPVYNAIVWQCRRTAPICEEMKERGIEDYVRHSTGLILDAYFSGTKIKWMFDNVEGVRELADQDRLMFGTVDTWLVWKLTGGKKHVTDVTNASRTMLFNIRTLKWDKKLLAILHIPFSILPEIGSSSHVFGTTHPSFFDGLEIPITGIAGDQQAALFGQVCFESGDVKSTYGTGCFLMMNTGAEPVVSKNRLLTTLAWRVGNSVEYALEGSIFTGGAVVQWLRDEMRLISSYGESETAARSLDDTGGVYVVPAFVGLGAPFWDMYARGTIVGMTMNTNRNHIIRASLEAIAYRTKDVLDAIIEDSGLAVSNLKADGGASANDFLMQFQADILSVPVVRPKVIETTALGAAYLAGLAVGFWQDMKEVQESWEAGAEFEPVMGIEKRTILYEGWKKAVKCASSWNSEGN